MRVSEVLAKMETATVIYGHDGVTFKFFGPVKVDGYDYGIYHLNVGEVHLILADRFLANAEISEKEIDCHVGSRVLYIREGRVEA